MKKTMMMVAITLVCGVMVLHAQDKDNSLFFGPSNMPNSLKWLPEPPDTLTTHFAYDMERYAWGKAQRLDTRRAPIAVRDAEWGINVVMKEFSEPFGLQISKEETPYIYQLLDLSIRSADEMAKIPKNYYKRKRPFVKLKEPTITPREEPFLRTNGSYPSGHTILGWLTALLLTEINPANGDTLMARGIMYAESRVIVGAHWQSDIDAGFLMASAAYSNLHANERFLALMKAARKEFKKKTKKRK